MNRNEQNGSEMSENHSFFKIAGMLIAFVGVLAAATAATVVILRKVKKAVAQINLDTEFEPLDEDDLTQTDPEKAEDREGCSIGDEDEETDADVKAEEVEEPAEEA